MLMIGAMPWLQNVMWWHFVHWILVTLSISLVREPQGALESLLTALADIPKKTLWLRSRVGKCSGI